MTTLPGARLTISGINRKVPLNLIRDYVGTAYSQQPRNDFDAEAVFVGHGICAPEFGWDDYKGEDLKGKVLVYFTNEPSSDDPNFFEGPALTYYGRWTYKFEEAKRRGAVAALIIHTAPTAGYGWGVVSGSWSQERPQMKLEPGERGLQLAAWVLNFGRHRLRWEAAGFRENNVRRLQRKALPSAVGRISRRLGLWKYGANGGFWAHARPGRCKHAEAADLESWRRVFA